jgi:hypothetical protein
MVFSDVTNNLGIVQQVRALMRVDATQWPTWKIVNSCNNWLDTITGYAIGADKRFQWDDTNHTKLPIGTTDLVADQSDYSFLTDEQGNKILTLTRIDILQTTGGVYEQLFPIDQTAAIPYCYDKIADNIIRLYPKPVSSITNGLKFYFQRTASYFVATDTTKEPGVAPLLHRGFVVASAYDGAITLGLKNLQPLSLEMQREDAKMRQYFSDRNRDEETIITTEPICFM